MLKSMIAALTILFSLTLITPAYAGLYPLEEPNFSVAKSDQRTIENVVVDSLSNYGWKVSGKSAGVISATYVKGKLSASISVACTDSSVSIKYVDSQGLSYDSEEREIHGTYIRWVSNLEQKITLKANNALYKN